MSGLARRGTVTPADRAAERAWELVASGADEADGVRPQILESWVRCRDELGIDPARDRALRAEDPVLAPAESVAAAELGAAAMRLLPDAAALGGVVVVADGRGRMLSAWGDEDSAARGGEQNLSPLYSWAEQYRPDRFEETALRSYASGRSSYAGQMATGVWALRGVRARVAYGAALLVPDRHYVAEREGTYVRRWVRAWSLVRPSRSTP